MRLRPVLYATGLMTAALGAAMMPPALLDYLDDASDWRIFALLGFLAMVSGGVLSLATYQKDEQVRVHEAFVLTVTVWGALTLVGAGPFLGYGMSLTDAFFESMSGLTTTGATVITGLDNLPRGVLLWRAILQWIGGIGIIVTAIAILPMLKVGGMQLFQMESSDASGKFLPRVSEIASQTGLVYVGLTALCAALYRVAGMGDFDALAHAFTTVSAGGFSTTDESFGAFVSGGADMVAIVFMMLAGLPFGLMVLALRGNLTAFLRDPQPRVFFLIAISAATLMTLYISRAAPELIGPEGPIRAATFNVVSILTGTGYGTTNFGAWGPFASALFLVLMFLGGCAGSAACGMKTFRIHITFLALQAYARGMARPNRVAPVRYAGRIVRRETMQSIMLFMFLYLASFAVLASALAMMRDIDAVTAISAAAASISNVGPGLGEMVGPTGTYQDFPILAKWLCAFAMLLGRLELIAAFVILSPRFWRG